MAEHVDSSSWTMLSLGDSYSIGEGVPADLTWPAQLISRLRAAGRRMDDVEILATTGWTTDELLEAAAQYTFNPPYALVSLLIGVNNQFRGRPLETYSMEFERLLDLAVEQAGGEAGKVIVVSIPDWGVTPFARKEGFDDAAVAVEIDRFNASAREQAMQRGAHWVDITGASRGVARTFMADDGLHPSDKQYALWVDLILPVACQLLDTPLRRPD
ncbi:SGNH/GDSL hydrolase family protein [Dokdonella sp.]|uniref:SGNH/GDSL hydrolase family protein n=1 Tax=Dokdonella sp. TaxID=2291710 RepID=UPI003C4D4306